ncbi:GntR domain protein (plasmid) [Neorhizobium galegae bv. officinalis bv. officinalis str. HAMBI 1141]|jgi:DNA-binding FadR family transcriptional regulator|uniref:GntR domain protein n=1 Tax=Neorhizobium galegae bv. officinalis bv. officinalis str. HAMBI 1141 TaxID=1028801 RepID=A0A068THJ0_NEOGA|nr:MULTISPECIES: FadR/GntR family transcriptional regulator [Neorhizobium]MCJ9669703.1 FadR family transcriptional regulator [Neorhizobium sp. SHOUNA12B]MCJ9746095.1 FadR family transcriptional regulator [Neorhizobium sp. SHOUNA12A]MCJ9751034.1 FadR family transcriptional regulator [Neorhizobium sp. BETTINA12A]CDN57872.1 GntR domain protein [Neorhizobium galegae bv. officinalis bv. officinalis str. HAMBI 1141]
MNQAGVIAAAKAEPRFSDIIYERIVEMIADGRFPVNERLPSEPNLSVMFGASRPVVREALERLRADQLIVSRKGSGSYVRQRPDSSVLNQVPVGSLADVQRFFEFRAGLEAEAAALAARNWQVNDKVRIMAALAALEHCLEVGELGAEEDQRLHDAIAMATGNQFHTIVREWFKPHFSIGMSVTRSLSLKRTPLHVRHVQDEHAAIVEAILARRETDAHNAMKTHILNARARMFQGVEAQSIDA